jgi:cytochrome c-type biogenesis protein CcmH/NrfG
LKKLSEAEAALEKRLSELEGRVERKLGEQIESSLASRMDKVQKMVALGQNHSSAMVRTMEKRLSEGGRGWMIPFALLVAFVAGITYVAWTRYRKLMKSHFL